MKCNEIALLVNELTEIAKHFHSHASLRDRISSAVVSAQKSSGDSNKEFFSKNVPRCTECNAEQVNLLVWTDEEAAWNCDICEHYFTTKR